MPPSKPLLTRLKDELGISALSRIPRDSSIMLLTRTLRMLAFGSSTLVLALYFSSIGLSDAQIGLFMTLTLAGDVLISLGLTFIADGLGRRRILLLGSALMVFSGAVFATSASYWVLLFAAVVGVVSPSGNEIGPFRAIEESTLAHLTPDADRGDVFAWYVVFGTLGTSAGAVVGGLMTQVLRQELGWEQEVAYRGVFWLYAFIGLVKSGLTLLLSERCEIRVPAREAEASGARDDDDEGGGEEGEGLIQGPGRQQPPAQPAPKRKWFFAQITPSSRKTLLKLCSLFSIDSLASGMVPVSLVTYYISKKFPIQESTLGWIVAVAWFFSSIGNVLASSISKRIGFIHTMVFTHLPSAVFLALLPAPNSLALTVVFLVLRASLASMDQAPRSAFLAAIVLPSERTAVMGVVNTVKTTAQSGGPLITGFLAAGNRFGVAFVVAGVLKAGYDLGLLYIFSQVKTGRNEDEARNLGRIGERDRHFEAEEEEEEERIELQRADRRGPA